MAKSIIADHTYHFMATIYPANNGQFQHDNALCHKAQVTLNWFDDYADVSKSEWNKADLGCSRKGDLFIFEKSVTIISCNIVKQRIVSNSCHKDLRTK